MKYGRYEGSTHFGYLHSRLDFLYRPNQSYRKNNIRLILNNSLTQNIPYHTFVIIISSNNKMKYALENAIKGTISQENTRLVFNGVMVSLLPMNQQLLEVKIWNPTLYLIAGSFGCLHTIYLKNVY